MDRYWEGNKSGQYLFCYCTALSKCNMNVACVLYEFLYFQ